METPTMIDARLYRDGMALLTGAVNVITTDGAAGAAGITATAVCTVTDQPPTLLVCVNRNSYAHRFFVTNGVLCVNLLSAEQQALSGVFSNRELSMPERFARASCDTLETGSPVLAEALANFDCHIVNTQEVGSHSIFLCEVAELRLGAPKPGLVYFNRNYHHLPA